MTHEFKQLIEAYLKAKDAGQKAVLATVVDLEGSSYRKPGVRMLLLENGQMIGAVSGGCVEKDILRRSQAVFESGKNMMMTYDGRYRLGCEGILYILLEQFQPHKDFVSAFHKCIEKRDHFNVGSFFKREEGVLSGLGTYFEIDSKKYTAHEGSNILKASDKNLQLFQETLPPCFKIMIFGAEHDAVVLCQYASMNGWEVSIISGPLESKTIANFPGATSFFSVSPNAIELDRIDSETAIVLMSHNFANDLKYLLEIKDAKPAYLGILGPAHRREKLLDQVLEYCPSISQAFLESLHGPAGLDLGAETPQEIAISILSEILTVVRHKIPLSLREKDGGIHA